MFITDPISYARYVQQQAQSNQISDAQLLNVTERIGELFFSPSGYFSRQSQAPSSSYQLVVELLSPDSDYAKVLIEKHNQQLQMLSQPQTFSQTTKLAIFEQSSSMSQSALGRFIQKMSAGMANSQLSLECNNYEEHDENPYLALIKRWLDADLSKIRGRASFVVQAQNQTKRVARIVFAEDFREYLCQKLSMQALQYCCETDLTTCLCDELAQEEEEMLDVNKTAITRKTCPVKSIRSMSLLVLIQVLVHQKQKLFVEFCVNLLMESYCHIQKPLIAYSLLRIINQLDSPQIFMNILGVTKFLTHYAQLIKKVYLIPHGKKVDPNFVQYQQNQRFKVYCFDQLLLCLSNFSQFLQTKAYQADYIDLYSLVLKSDTKIVSLSTLLQKASFDILSETMKPDLYGELANVQSAVASLVTQINYQVADPINESLSVQQLSDSIGSLIVKQIKKVCGHEQQLTEEQQLQEEKISFYGLFAVRFVTLNRLFGVQRQYQQLQKKLDELDYLVKLEASGVHVELQAEKKVNEEAYVIKQIVQSQQFWTAAGIGAVVIIGARGLLAWLLRKE